MRGALCVALIAAGSLAVPGSARAGEPAPPQPAEPREESDGADPGDGDDDDWGGDDDGTDWGGDGGDSGADFDFGKEPVVKTPELVEEPSPWVLSGFIRTDLALWVERFDDNPFAKLRQSIDLSVSYKNDWFWLLLSGHAEYDFAYLVDRKRFDDPTKETYESQIETREMFVQGTWGRVELTLGRQIVAWGEGDVFSPLDVVNPRDNREPGTADLDDIRLPVVATRLQWFPGRHRVELMLVHEFWPGYVPPPRGPFSPFDQLLADADPAQATLLEGVRHIDFRHSPERFSADSQQPMLRWIYRGEGYDIGAYFAWVNDKQGVLDLDFVDLLQQINAIEEDPDRRLYLDMRHEKYFVVGTSGAVPYGSWLFKWEVSADLDKAVNTGEPPLSFGIERTHLLNTMFGVTWTGVEDLNIGFEIWKPWVLDPPDGETLFPLDEPFMALRGSYTFLDQKMTINVAATMIGWTANVGFLARADVSYELAPALDLTLGFVTYWPGDDFGPFYGLDTHDRVFVKLRWDFVSQ